MRSADDAAVSEPSENGRGFVNKMTPPLVMGPEAIDTDIWARGSRIPSTFENDNASDPSAFAAVHRNRPSDHPGLFLEPDSWDSFYVDENGLLQSGWKEKWDFTTGEEWDRFYLDRNGVI